MVIVGRIALPLGVDGRLSVPVVRLAKRIFVNCHRNNDLWPSSMRFRAPSETHPHTLELTPARHALRQAIARERARREAGDRPRSDAAGTGRHCGRARMRAIKKYAPR